MELFIPLLVAFIGVQYLKGQDQRARIALLGRYLGKYQIERLMENLNAGYMRALDEADLERRAQIWSMLGTAETELSEQFRRFVEDFAKVWGDKTQVSTLRLAVPYATKLFPRAAFDLRHVLAIHANGIAATVENRRQLSQRDKAYTLTAEMLLMQHSCHWYCRSRAVASARMLARHQTSHAQLIAAVSAQTREAYCQLTGC
jgi:hypothetical protein